MSELPKAAIVRLAKEAGKDVRIGDEAATALLEAAEAYVKRVAEKALAIAEDCNRVTIKANDIRNAKLL